MEKDREFDFDINFGNTNFVNVKSNLIVEIEDSFVLHAPDSAYELKVKVVADLESVPEKYREVFLNMLTTKYLNRVNFTENPFSVCVEKKKKGLITRGFDYIASLF